MKRTAVILTSILGVLAALVIAAFGYYFFVTAGSKLSSEKLTLPESSLSVFDADGVKINTEKENKIAPIAECPEHLPNAFVAVEDKRFYSHHGFDYKRIGKALLKNAASFSFKEGASTLSQQLIKNTHLSGEKTVKRKLKELKLTRALEAHYSKEKIMELYLNSIYFGHNEFGVQNAAKFYFGKAVSELTPAESATLAALVRSPNVYSPFKNAEKCLSRRNFVLKLMREQGFLTDSEYNEATKEPLPEAPHEKNERNNSYLSLVYDELFTLYPEADCELLNLRVHTYAQSALQAELEKINVQSDVCALVIDNDSHALKAYFSTAGNIKRLPASTVKPLLVYAPAIEENVISPATPLLDEKTDFSGYCPSNYGGTYNGYVSARYALSHSLNVPAVKILNTLGIEKACAYLNRMELSPDKDDYSLALALGGMKEGFTLPALASAYSTFACGGDFAQARTIRKIETANGKVIYKHKPVTRKVFSQDVCFLINDILRETAQSGTAKKLSSLGFPICAKTGTGGGANGNTDAYTVSYTKDDTVAVRLGNRDNTPISATGGGLPANIALSINKFLYRNRAPQPFGDCEEVEKLSFDREEYEKNHKILLSDPAAPQLFEMSDYFRKCARPQETSSRFSVPTIQKPTIYVKNGAVKIVLCHAEYYDYIIKRENKGKTEIIYQGKFRETIYDNSVRGGESYTYCVIPVYAGKEGAPVYLPSVKIDGNNQVPDEWWE